MSKNVIRFPTERRIDQMLKKEIDNMAREKDEDVINDDQQQLIEHLMTVMVDELVAEGYGVDAEELVYDVSFLYEVIKSLVLKMDGYDHPVQDFANNLYEQFMDEVNFNTNLQMSFDFDYVQEEENSVE